MTFELSEYSAHGEDFDVYLARPQSPGPHPVVLVCHAWGGRDEFAEDKARRLAKLGYLGAAIDVYGRGKRGSDTASCQALMTPLLDEPDLLQRRLRAAFEHVQGLPGVEPGKLSAIGYCFGGLCSILLARMGLGLRTVTSFHGLLKIGQPLDAAVSTKIQVLHGQDDPMVPPSDVGLFAEEMKRINADWQLHAFPGVMHAFTNPSANAPESGMVYNEVAARQSWAEMVRFVEEGLA